MKLLLNATEVAEMLNISKGAVNNARTGKALMGMAGPPYIKMGRSVRYKRETVLEWIESHPELSRKEQHDKEKSPN